MTPDPLDRLLADLATESLPSPPANLEANTLRAIRIEAAEHDFAPWPNWLSLPRFAAASAVLALLFGLLIGNAARGAREETANAAVARQVLALEVFDPHAPGLPHQLLEHP